MDIAKAGRLLQTKPAYGGNIVSVIMGATTPQLATVRARMYEPLEPRDDAEAEVRALSRQRPAGCKSAGSWRSAATNRRASTSMRPT